MPHADRKGIVASLLDADLAAAKAAESARCALDEGAGAFGVLPHLRAYVLAKYRLAPEECGSSGLEELAEASLAKALATDPELARKANAASTCDGASTTDMKQALLFMALQKDFGVRLDGIQLAFAETLEDLAALVTEAAGGKEAAG